MEAEKISVELKDKVGETSLSDKTISDYVSQNLPADGTEPDEAYFTKHVNFLKSLSGNFNHDIAEKVNTQVEEFKKNYKPKPLEEPSKIEEKNKKVPKDGNDDKYSKLENRITELTSKLDARDKAEAQSLYKKNLQEKFKSELEGKNLIYDPVYYKYVESELGEIDTKKDVESTIKEITPKYEKLLTDNNRNGGVPSNGGYGSGQQNGKKALDSFFAQKKAEEGWGNKK